MVFSKIRNTTSDAANLLPGFTKVDDSTRVTTHNVLIDLASVASITLNPDDIKDMKFMLKLAIDGPSTTSVTFSIFMNNFANQTMAQHLQELLGLQHDGDCGILSVLSETPITGNFTTINLTTDDTNMSPATLTLYKSPQGEFPSVGIVRILVCATSVKSGFETCTWSIIPQNDSTSSGGETIDIIATDATYTISSNSTTRIGNVVYVQFIFFRPALALAAATQNLVATIANQVKNRPSATSASLAGYVTTLGTFFGFECAISAADGEIFVKPGVAVPSPNFIIITGSYIART